MDHSDEINLDDFPQPAIESICQTLLNEEKFLSVLQLMRTGHRYRLICQPLVTQYKQQIMNQPPTLIDSDGTQRWFQHGIHSNGVLGWFRNGQCHRDGATDSETATLFPNRSP